MSQRRLPTVIGLTENALRNLLSQVLASTMIDEYDEWVALNCIRNNTGTAVVAALAAALKIEHGAAEETIERLANRGLVADLALTPTGEAQLLRARGAVAAITDTLVAGIDEADQQTTRTVLDTVRERAETASAVL